MKFLSTAPRLTLVTFQSRQGDASLFIVSPEMAAMLTWFLSSTWARLLALVAYCLIRRVVLKCREIYSDLAAIPGELGEAVREAVLGFFLGGVVYAP